MKTFLKILGVIILLIAGYVFYIFSSTGAFRSIQNTYPSEGEISNYDLPGVEDIAISREDEFLILSSDHRAARRDGEAYVSGLYFMDLRESDTIYQNAGTFILEVPEELRLYPHGISLLKIDSNTHRLLVVNHVSDSNDALGSADLNTVHSIEEFLLRNRRLTHIKTHIDEAILSPNDVAAVGEKGFYLSNDHGSTTHLGLLTEDYLGFKKANVVYYDGANYKKVAGDIAYANGVYYDQSRELVYVAAPREFAVKVYKKAANGDLSLEARIDCNSGVDNIELDEDGKIWIGSHPDLLTFAAYAAGDKKVSPSEIITIEYKSANDYQVNSIYVSDGSDMSASTTAVAYKDKVYLGNVMDDHFISLDRGLLNN